MHHITWSVNSICHNHRAFPRSARHGLRSWSLDPSAVVIAALEKVGLAPNVIRIPPERQAQKAREAAEARAAREGCAAVSA